MYGNKWHYQKKTSVCLVCHKCGWNEVVAKSDAFAGVFQSFVQGITRGTFVDQMI